MNVPHAQLSPLISQLRIPRRELLKQSGLGFGALALAYLLHDEWLLGAEGLAGSDTRRVADLSANPSHFPGPAKAVIQLVQNGGPSQMDLFDPKPELQKRDGIE
ncbi:MAG: DUF1501 domain-containing protein, partial [Planctomycetes bacterium]|nr:DUF1501 domain-containing protein [Planctomycetota bacterium]